MIKIATLKAQAKNLKLALAEMGIPLTQAQSLEAMAKQYGMPNWDAAAGILKKKPTPKTYALADMPLYPSEVKVEKSYSPYATKYNVEAYEWEGIALLHNRTALEAFLTEHGDDGLDSTAIELFGDGENIRYTYRQLLGITYSDLQMGFWDLADGETTLMFYCDGLWQPEKAEKPRSDLELPDLVKSAKGCKLLRLCSHDGAEYDKFIIVPPHLNLETVKLLFDKEIARLKELDRENEDNPDFDEYDEDTLHEFATRNGCLWVGDDTSATVGQNWD